MKQIVLVAIASAAVLGIVAYQPAVADQLRYMDTSGNINFVDQLTEVPRQYREQVVPPTPVPQYDKKTQALIRRKQREEEVKRIRAERLKEREELRKQRLKAAELKKLEKENKRRGQIERLEKGKK